VLSFAREYPEPADPTKKYTSTWFDMFRIETAKIAEHRDAGKMRDAARPNREVSVDPNEIWPKMFARVCLKRSSTTPAPSRRRKMENA